MGLLVATTGVDFMSGKDLNVMSTMDGRVTLASKNLFLDPGLREYDDIRKRHRFWDLEAPPRPSHWAAYVNDKKTVLSLSRQLSLPMPMSDTSLEIKDELVRGASPINESRAFPISEPAAPLVNVRPVSGMVGFPAGWYCIAFAYLVGTNAEFSSRMTSFGPKSEPFQLAQGQAFNLSLGGSELGEGVSGLVIGLTDAMQSSAAALNTTVLYPQIFLRQSGIPPQLRMTGPLRKRQGIEGGWNETFIGNDLAGVKHWVSSSGFSHAKDIKAKVSYVLITENGISKPSNPYPIEGEVSAEKGRNEVRFRPISIPTAARGWQPRVKFKVDDEWTQWYAITKKGGTSYYSKSEHASIISNEPGKWDKNSTTRVQELHIVNGEVIKDTRTGNNGNTTGSGGGGSAARADETKDTTGVKAPTEAPEVPSIININTSGLTPGPHFVATSMWAGSSEGPLSPTTRVDVPLGSGLSIRRPLYHNRLINADMGEASTDDPNVPRSWILHRPLPASSTVTMKDNIIRFTDKSNGNTDFNVFDTPFAVLHVGEFRYNMRWKVGMSEYTNGAFRLILDEYNSNEVLIASTSVDKYMEAQSRVCSIKLSKLNTDVGNPSVIKLQPATTQVRLRGRAVGAGKAGTVNYKVEFSNWGTFEGWATPRAVDRLDEFQTSKGERPADAIPHGGYCVVVEEGDEFAPPVPNFEIFEEHQFENGTMPNGFVEKTYGDATGITMQVSRDAAIWGDYGLRVARTSGTASGGKGWRKKVVPNESLKASVAFDFQVTRITTDQTYTLATILDLQENKMGDVRYISSTGALQLRYTDRLGASSNVNIGRGIEVGDRVSVEVIMHSTDRDDCTIVAYTGSNENNRKETARIPNVKMAGKKIAYAEFGMTVADAANSGLWSFAIDRIVVSKNGTENYITETGNYIEYYGPVGTPHGNELYGPTGMKMPVVGGAWYTISVNVHGQDVTPGSNLLRFAGKSPSHEITANFGAVVRGLAGDSKWTRYTKTVYMPPGTAYVHFYANDLAAGTIRIHGMQMERGKVATDFTDRHYRHGWFELVFDTGIPDIINQYDPAAYLDTVKKLKEVRVAGTNTADTSYVLRFASGDTLSTFGEYTNNINDLPTRPKLLKVRVDMSTLVDTVSPEIDAIEIDIVRPTATLCKPNGTEYSGGVVVRNVPAEHPERMVENIMFANGRPGFSTWGNEPVSWFRDLTIEVYRASTVADIVSNYGYRNSVYTLELENMRYKVRFDEMPNFKPKPKSRIKRGDGLEDFQVHTAEGVSMYVLASEDRRHAG